MLSAALTVSPSSQRAAKVEPLHDGVDVYAFEVFVKDLADSDDG